MLLAFIHQSIIFIVLYYVYSNLQINEQSQVHDEDVVEVQNCSRRNGGTSLAVVDELKWLFAPKYLESVIIDDRFIVGGHLGGGFSGFVRSGNTIGVDLRTGEEVAIKFAKPKMHEWIEKEYVSYLYLGADDPDIVQVGIPHLIHYGDFGGYKIIVITKTGPTLHRLVNSRKSNRFEMPTVCKIAIQGIRIFEYIHNRGLLFQDIKPDNMAIGNVNENQIFFFDFGFSGFHVNALGEPKDREEAVEQSGTPEYMAFGPLNMFTSVRKDELISFGIVLLKLNDAYIPWMDKVGDDDTYYEAMQIVLEEWKKHNILDICKNSDNPRLFTKYFEYLHSLVSNEKPDYDWLVNLFENELSDEEIANEDLDVYDDDFDDDSRRESRTDLAVVYDLERHITHENIEGVIIDERFVVGKHLGGNSGTFVRSGVDLRTAETVAIKFSIEKYHKFAENEYINYLRLGAEDPDILNLGIPHIKHYGRFGKYSILVMTKTGPTLEDLIYQKANQKFELPTVVKIAIQGIRIFEYLHNKDLVFLDVKPSNMAIGDVNKNQVIFFDFEFSEFHVNALGESMGRKKIKSPTATPEYMAYAPLHYLSHVRKDDLISFGIILLELNGVSLPWADKTNDDFDVHERIETVLEEWNNNGPYVLSMDSDNPNLFTKYFEYLDSLVSNEKPDYDWLVNLFENELTHEEIKSEDLLIHDSEENVSSKTNDSRGNTTALAIIHELKWVIPEEYLEGVVIDKRFLIGEQLGDGYTGFVRSAIDLQSGAEVAIKFATKKLFHSLENEFINYLQLGADDPDIVEFGIPHLIHYGEFGGYTILVLTKTGPNLHDLRFQTTTDEFDLKTVYKIAIQAIRIFQYIHSKGLLFLDVKPENMAVGNSNKNQIFFFDFAFSTFHSDALGVPKKRVKVSSYDGTPEYMARGPLNRYSHVRKDDFIAFGLVMLELSGVDLPWLDKTSDDHSMEEVMDIVLEEWDKHGTEGICEGSGNPELFIKYFNYFDNLESDEEPDYDWLVQLFQNELTEDEIVQEDLGIETISHAEKVEISQSLDEFRFRKNAIFH